MRVTFFSRFSFLQKRISMGGNTGCGAQPAARARATAGWQRAARREIIITKVTNAEQQRSSAAGCSLHDSTEEDQLGRGRSHEAAPEQQQRRSSSSSV
jgi:hypothetical protein